MARIEEVFESISDAWECLCESTKSISLTEVDRETIQRLYRETKPGLPALDYALKLFREEPKLVTGRRELADACSDVYHCVCQIDAIVHLEKPQALRAITADILYSISAKQRSICTGYYHMHIKKCAEWDPCAVVKLIAKKAAPS